MMRIGELPRALGGWALLALTLLLLLHAAPSRAEGTLKGLAPKPLLAPTPPMGWSSWNKFACNIDEGKVRAMADAMISSGMREAGYQYVNLDGCWAKSRDADGRLQPDPVKFPSGMKALADYVHARGLKFGIYSDGGTNTCDGTQGSLGREYQDAKTFAEWGVDYLKYDWCNTGTADTRTGYAVMADALRKSGRDIVFSICEWGLTQPWTWAAGVGHLWRTTGDIDDSWSGKKEHSQGWTDILDQNVALDSYAGPHQWNDPDMLEVGNGGMSDTEYRAHFSLWAMLAAPLIAGNDLSRMDAATLAILVNRDVIAVDQDPLGLQARRVRKNGDLEVWARRLAGGHRAIVLFNRSERAQQMTAEWADVSWPETLRADVRDLWSKQRTRDVRGRYAARVPGHGVVMLRLEPVG